MRVVEGPGAPGPRGPLGLPRSELGHPLPDAVTEGAGVRDRGAREGSDPPGRGACLPVLTGRGACWCSAVPHPPGGVSPPDGGAPPSHCFRLSALAVRGPVRPQGPAWRCHPPRRPGHSEPQFPRPSAGWGGGRKQTCPLGAGSAVPERMPVVWRESGGGTIGGWPPHPASGTNSP